MASPSMYRTAAGSEIPSSWPSKYEGDEGPGEAEPEQDDALPQPPLDRKCEPRVERRNDEDERVGLRQCDRDGDGSDEGERDGETCQPLLGGRLGSGDESLAHDEPDDGKGCREQEKAHDRGLAEHVRVRGEREWSAGREHAGQRPEPQEQSGEKREADARSQRSQRRPEGKPSATGANDQIDHAECERDDEQDERQSHRPAACGAVAEEEAVGCVERAPYASVERAQQGLGRAAELSEPLDVEARVRVSGRNRRVIGIRRRERHGRDAVAEEPSLLACRIWHSEVQQLQRSRRQRGRDADALLDTTGSGTHEDAGR